MTETTEPVAAAAAPEAKTPEAATTTPTTEDKKTNGDTATAEAKGDEGATAAAAATADEAAKEEPKEPPKEMRAVVLTGFGGYKGVKILKRPEPSVQAGEVVIRIRAW